MAEDREHADQDPIRFTDKRRIDPETGQPRDPAEDAVEGQATAEDREAAAGDPLADPLAEAERILRDIPEEDVEDIETIGDAQDGAGGDPVTVEEAAGAEVGPEDAEPEAQGYDRETELEDDLRRVQAEYVNYRRRVERDRGLEKERIKGQMITELMPVLDDVAAARQAGDLQDGPFADIAGRLEQILAQEGLETLGVVGEKFNPNEHEAIMQQPSDEVEADHVAILVRSGYRHGDRLLRAAQVIVSSGPAD